MKFVRSMLDTLEVIAKRPRNGLFDRVELLCHIDFRRYFACESPTLAFSELVGFESTEEGEGCAQLLLIRFGAGRKSSQINGFGSTNSHGGAG